MCLEKFSCSSPPAESPDFHLCSCDTRTALCSFPLCPNGHISGSISSYPCVFSIFRPSSQPLQLLPYTDRRDREERDFLKHQHMEQAVESAGNPRLAISNPEPHPIISLTGRTDILASTGEEPQKPNLSGFNLHYYTLARESWTESTVILAHHLLRHRLLFSKGFCHV